MTSYDDTKVQLTINRMTEECYENVPDKSSTELYLVSQDPTSIAKIDLDAQGRTDAEISSLKQDLNALSSQTAQNAQDIADISANLTHSTVRRWEYVEDDTVLTFTANQANSNVAMQKVGSAPEVSLEYTTDGGYTWNDFIVGETTVALPNIGDQIGLRAKTPNAQLATSNDNRNSFSMTGEVVVSGNLAAILNKNVEQGKVLDSTLTYHLCGLFQDCTSLVGSAKGLVIPFETLYGDSLNSLFKNTRITIAPDLPCMNIGIGSYSTMFYDCTSLTTAPELPATTIADYAYYHMFHNCTALTTPPSVLPATSPNKECYRQMFIGCTSLTRTPDIKMQNIWSNTQNAMWDMFKNCTSLETATVNHMKQVNGNNGMAYMFIDCTSLKNVGLKSLSGVGNSYGLRQMLDGCSALEVVDFSEATSVPNLYYASTFQNTNSTFKIVVPDELYDQWIVASNWSNFASQIVKASEYINN